MYYALAVEQFSLDGGQWDVASELLAEAPPPFASFANHGGDDNDLPHSALCRLLTGLNGRDIFGFARLDSAERKSDKQNETATK